MLTPEQELTNVETLAHISRVRDLLSLCIDDLKNRAENHDKSKLSSPEVEIFTEFTPKLRDSVYLSDEYNQFRKEMGVALDHHYKHNSHHPEHYENGIDGMNLLDLIEMFVDWKAASERHTTGDINKSIILNIERFKLSPQLVNILNNTVNYLFKSSSV